jgi:GT2 family glycosyltransferase
LDVSVIIVSWNTRDILRDCLESIAEQTRRVTYEIIVVDNASSDDTVEMLKRDFSQVTVVENEENLGFSRGNNIGIDRSSGRYMALINSDVILLDGCLDRMVDYMDSHANTGMAGPRILNHDGSLQVSCRKFPTLWNNFCQAIGLNYLFPKSPLFSEPFMKYWAHDQEREVDVLSGCFWMIRREALEQVGLLDEAFFFYGEDIDWCKRFHKADWGVTFYPGAEAIHLGAASSRRMPIKFYLELQKADLRYWRKHHGRLGKFAYACVITFRHALRLVLGGMLYVLRPSQRPETGYKLKRNSACLRWLFLSAS